MNIVPQKQTSQPYFIKSKPEYIVAIGGSAGFLQPLIEFFHHVHTNNVSYVVLRHIGRNVRSELASILQLHSSLKVVDATYKMEVKNNTVYILPPGFYMTIKNNYFYLFERTGLENCAIDIFMESLSKEYHEKSIGVILSGSGTNGTKGATFIKKAGGHIITQMPSTCDFDFMPKSAIETGYVDDVALPGDMPSLIEKYMHEEPLANHSR